MFFSFRLNVQLKKNAKMPQICSQYVKEELASKIMGFLYYSENLNWKDGLYKNLSIIGHQTVVVLIMEMECVLMDMNAITMDNVKR